MVGLVIFIMLIYTIFIRIYYHLKEEWYPRYKCGCEYCKSKQEWVRRMCRNNWPAPL